MGNRCKGQWNNFYEFAEFVHDFLAKFRYLIALPCIRFDDKPQF